MRVADNNNNNTRARLPGGSRSSAGVAVDDLLALGCWAACRVVTCESGEECAW